MAVTLEKGAQCSGCGTAPWEWEEDPFAYGPVVTVCPGCQRKEALSSTEIPLGGAVTLVEKREAERIDREQYEREREARAEALEEAEDQ